MHTKKRRKMNIDSIITQSNPRSKVCSVARVQMDTQTYTKLKTSDTFSGFDVFSPSAYHQYRSNTIEQVLTDNLLSYILYCTLEMGHLDVITV